MLAEDDATISEIDTPHGPARAQLYRPTGRAKPAGLMLLGHGAGGGVRAVDLHLAAAVALEHRYAVGLIEQPYRVAGRKAPAPAKQVDAAWEAVVAELRPAYSKGPLVCGGRSFGARVACRTADAVGADGVLALAFPVHPPGRPEKSRQDELSAVTVPTLVIQGRSDPFGRPEAPPQGEVVFVDGDHGLKKDAATIRSNIDTWLGTL
ncbi:alpha/beta hydrolase [Epidermidibacterium keratini]|uniref:Alpha/beta hydrolase n=1 Tax=Epidermidibacterium keratini TaxID=1891644 RepID=A0A7L4YLK0_9ACTN|nr:alpha/beta family hydrolase [Epidermidibacterium keratini]QHB99947.1 alpha/beta hydrolase [Epidermidibacterium keratini]